MDHATRSALETTRDLTANLAQHAQAGVYSARLAVWSRLADACLSSDEVQNPGIILGMITTALCRLVPELSGPFRGAVDLAVAQLARVDVGDLTTPPPSAGLADASDVAQEPAPFPDADPSPAVVTVSRLPEVKASPLVLQLRHMDRLHKMLDKALEVIQRQPGRLALDIGDQEVRLGEGEIRTFRGLLTGCLSLGEAYKDLATFPLRQAYAASVQLLSHFLAKTRRDAREPALPMPSANGA